MSHEQTSKPKSRIEKTVPAFVENRDGSFRRNPDLNQSTSRKPPTATKKEVKR